MARLLYIEASPMDELSFSSRIAKSFLEAYQASHPQDTVDTLNVWDQKLPEFNGSGVRARFKSSRSIPLEPDEKDIWEQVLANVHTFKSYDKYLISVPMWNFGIPWRLKQYFDLLAHPGLTFSFSPETGYAGLVTGKKATVICARGGAYPEGTPGAAFDFQQPYLKTFLGFIGITDQQYLMVEPTMGADADALLQAKQQEARKIAEQF